MPAVTDKSPPSVIGVELLQDISHMSEATDGFVKRYRHRVKSRLSDGMRTDSFVVDFVDRGEAQRDAVGVALYVAPPAGAPAAEAVVILRQQLRYPVYLVDRTPMFTEVVAGVIEGSEPAIECALREVFEETGFRVEREQARALGRAVYASPGIFTERVHTVAVELPAEALSHPSPAPGDGSEMERGAQVLALRLGDALAVCRGERLPDSELVIEDAKTELTLRRLLDDLERG